MSVCTKCGYPVGNHPFRHPFAPVMAEGPKPPAQESPCVPLDCGVGELRTRNAALLAEVERLKADLHRKNESVASARDAVFREGLARIEAEKQLAAVREALAGERAKCDRFWASGTTTRDHTDEAESVIDEDWFWGEWNAHKARRAAESKAAKERT